MLWQTGYARRSLRGREPTGNPVPAAARLLGLKPMRVTQWTTGRAGRHLAGRLRHKRRTGNPTAAEIAAMVPVPGAGLVGRGLSFLTSAFARPAVEAERGIAQQLSTMAMAGNLTAGSALINRGTIKTAGYADLYGPLVAAYQFQHPDWYKKAFDLMTPGKQPGGKPFWSYAQNDVIPAVTSFAVMATTPPGSVGNTGAAPKTATATSGPLLSGVSPAVAGAVAGAIVRGLTRTGRRAYYRYDQYGRRRRVSQRLAYREGYSDEQTGEHFAPQAASAGPSISVQAPEKFSVPTGLGGSLTGAAGKLAVAGVAIGGLAAGYYIGHALNRYLAGRQLAKQEAGVQAALAFRQARADAQARAGRPLTAAEVRSLGTQFKAGLVQLGYDPVDFTYHPTGIDRFFYGENEA